MYPTKPIKIDDANVKRSYDKMIRDIEIEKQGPRCRFKTFEDLCLSLIHI